MLAQKVIKLKLNFFILLLLLALFLGGALATPKVILAQAGDANSEAGQAPAADQSVIADLNRQIDEQRAKIDKLTEEITKHQDNIKNARGQAVNLQNQIYILNNQIAKANLDIESKEEEIKATELEIEKVELEIKENELLISQNKEKLAAFVRQLDRYDERSYLSVLLGNDTFSQFFDQIKYLESVRKDLQKTLNRVEELIAKLNTQKDDLDAKRDQLAKLLNQLENEKYALGDQKQTKQYLMVKTKQSENKFQNLINELKQEQIAVNAQIASLEKRLRETLAKKGEGEKFNALGDAALIWPITNPRITTYFHDPEYPFRYLFEHSGIDLGVNSGTSIRAAEAGYVAKVSIGTRWYGTYIMIIHSDNLATLYAHLQNASVVPDQYVSKGQVIGLSDNTGFSTGPHLHFEVRANGIPVNPLSYLP